MAIIRTSELSPGMILAADARDMSGRLLLGAGGEVTPKHLKIFKTWGITEVDVQQSEAGSQPEPGAEEEPLDLTAFALPVDPDEKFKKKASDYFCLNDLNHPLIQELFNHCVERMKVEPPPAPKKAEPPAKRGRRPLPQSARGLRHGRR